VITHPSVAGAAVLAGLIVAGGAYSARHDLGLGDGLQASAGARLQLEHELPLGHAGRHRRLLSWQAPHVPKVHVRRVVATPSVIVSSAAPVAAPAVAPAPTTRTSPAAPTTRTSPVPTTRTSPVGGDDGGGGDD
jgi:hypothetical protein